MVNLAAASHPFSFATFVRVERAVSVGSFTATSVYCHWYAVRTMNPLFHAVVISLLLLVV
jgi:hypothetical protein